MRLSGLFLLPLLAAIPAVLADAGGGIHPAGLTALINQANGLLSSGKYSEATRAYSEAIGMSSTPSLFVFRCSPQNLRHVA
jgi:hypothetical protein